MVISPDGQGHRIESPVGIATLINNWVRYYIINSEFKTQTTTTFSGEKEEWER